MSPNDTRHRADRRGEMRRDTDRSVVAVIEGMSDAFLAIGPPPEWEITYANREAARLNGVAPGALVGRSHWEVWPQTVGGEVERQYRRVVTERVPVQFEHYYDDVDAWHDIRAYPAADGGIAVFYRDITPQKRLEAERARQARELADAHTKAMAAETQFRLLVERVRDYAVFLLDPDGIVTYWGPGAQRIKLWTPDEIIGKHLSVLYPNRGDPAEDGSAEDHLRHAIAHGEYIGEGMREKKNGERFLARVVLTALRQNGELVGFSKITQDLSAERVRETALASAMMAAEAASMAKSQFLANTSHEIRTPLNAVMGYAELLSIGMAGSLTGQQRHYVQRIQATSRHLLGLINDVLDLAKVEAGEMRTARDPGLLAPVIEAALHLVEPQARTRQVVLTNACGPGPLAYVGDAERVRQIVANLLSNAVRFTEAGGRVTIVCGSVSRLPPEARVPPSDAVTGWTFVRVEDTGIGIAPDQLDRIWEAFIQADAAPTRRFGGSGLGLTISRHLARLMGGEITVRSVPGLGSSFALWLPAADPEAAHAVHRAALAGDAPLTPRDPIEMLRELAPRSGHALAELAEYLISETERVVATYAARLRADDRVPSARGLGETQVEDHAATFVVDLAQCVALVGEDGPQAAEMLRDGSMIQRLIADRHGAQRARLGFSEEETRREYEILREEIRAAVGRRGQAGGATADDARALEVIDHMLERARDESLRAFRQAAAG